MTLFLGVDPGLSGACALYDQTAQTVQVFDMPTHEITVNKKKKRRLDLYELARWFDINCSSVKLAVVEDPNAMPGQGVTSVFSFGFGCGVAQMAVASQFIPVLPIKPSEWKRKMGLSSDKDASRRLASQMLPRFSHLWARVKDDGRAEASLLALYGSKLA